MNRKEFLKVCGGTCIGILGLSLVGQSCTATHYVQGTVTNNTLLVPKGEFVAVSKGSEVKRSYVIVKSEKSDFPIVVYRLPENKYHAMLMRCSHQGSELSVNGDILTCSAHGSEFSKQGAVIQGPADQPLKIFPVTEDEKNIYIQLS